MGTLMLCSGSVGMVMPVAASAHSARRIEKRML